MGRKLHCGSSSRRSSTSSSSSFTPQYVPAQLTEPRGRPCLQFVHWGMSGTMSSAKIHPRCDSPWLAMGAGRTSQKALKKNVRSRNLTSPFSWNGRSARRQKSKDLCGCSEHGSESESSSSFISPFVLPSRNGKATRKGWFFGSVMDPQSRSIKKINRMFLLASTLGMFVDPLFLDTLTIDGKLTCLYVDKGYLLVVSVLRGMIDTMYLWHIWLQLKLAYMSRKSIVPGRGELVWDARDVALHYLCALRGFVFDIFVILPIPQVMLWVVVPYFVRQGGDVPDIMTYVLMAFLFQYIPKFFHIFLIIRRMQRVTGYVFGTALWGFGLNLICYMIASHVAGSVWYLLGVQRVERCVQSQCMTDTTACKPTYVGCPLPIAMPGSQPIDEKNLEWSQGNVTRLCFSNKSDYEWGIYSWAVPLVTTVNAVEKVMFNVLWGVMTLSSFGNALTPTNNLVEATFCVLVITSGLLMFTLLIGNIQVFLHSHASKKDAMQLKMRDIEWWMRRRQLPSNVRHRVRHSERERWAATRGVDEAAMISELPEGLQRDIKRHLCVDLVRRVPLFDQMDDLVINNICDRLKPLLYIKGETIVDEGDPVLRMFFVARGYVRSAYRMHNGNTSSCVLGPGNFAGDELVAWCLRKPQVDGLPPSTATLSTLNDVELFGLDAGDLRYITDHFRYKFDKKKLKNTARYWSSSWRTWAAVSVQLAWRRFKQQRDDKREKEKQGPLHEAFHFPLTVTEDERLRLYTAMMCSPKPQDYLV